MNTEMANLWKFYIAAILSGFAVFYNGVDTLFFRHFSLSFEQMSFLVSAHLLAVLVCEIPTGVLADMYGKKASILLGSCFGLLGLAFLAFGSTFVVFTVGFILLGISRAFRSGAETALLYDWLSSRGKQHDYTKHQSRLQAAFVGIDIISGSIGFLLFHLNVRLPFIISLVAMVLVIIAQWTFQDTHTREAHAQQPFTNSLHYIYKGFSIISKSPMLKWLIGFTLIFSIANMFFGNTLSLPFLQETKGFTNEQLALMGLIWNTIQTASLFFVGAVERKLGEFASLLAIVLLTPVLFLVLVLSSNVIISSMILGLYYSAMSFREVVIDAYVNTRISSHYRATVLSIASMIVSSVAILILPFLGAGVDRYGLTAGVVFLASSTLLLGMLSMIAKALFVRADVHEWLVTDSEELHF